MDGWVRRRGRQFIESMYVVRVVHKVFAFSQDSSWRRVSVMWRLFWRSLA